MTRGIQIPHALGLLPSSVVTKHLGRGVQSGIEPPATATLMKSAVMKAESQSRWRTRPIRELLDEAMNRYEGKRAAADEWLAPRLHATLRMTRHEAANEELWNFIALVVAPDYVVWRHKGAAVAAPARFSGAHYTQAFSRLWWAAELFRDGRDYAPVEVACRVQDALNTTMRLDVIDHRPTAQAILRIVNRLLSENTSHVGDYVNTLSSAVNTAGSTLVYDVLAPDAFVDDDALQVWIDAVENMPPVLWGILPEGPDDGYTNAQSVSTLVSLFEGLMADAPRRKRSRHVAEESSDDDQLC
ncbi:DUF6339 family protein [Rhodococcus sp. IEGM 1305]|uniref:DUF6339 family protein n=1 Tax=Rhodococcus sp. IEGM 1305 TaxID=3047092 RepID=UPI0024B7782F|nr:DUF6339 family protein [Rhodococcus sp. IEGM 1305]MDI9952870.1 DUF6339 family protein [Rhodococcus sp. IEGM 1305]